MKAKELSILSMPVIIGALGFYVDIYDLLLFSIVRKPSLQQIGLTEDQILNEGELIISLQMLGLMLGGFFWGILGDKKGRLSVLFGSILLYSLANIVNGFVTTPLQYSITRFIAGVGLAGELGASITLVCEMLPKAKRGLAASIIASVGVLGAISAFIVYQIFKDWRICYFIGGGMGLLLLLLRVKILESSMYDSVKESNVERGSLWLLVRKKERLFRYIKGVLIGLPVWYVIGILISFSDKFGKEFGITESIDPGKAVTFQYIALCFGDMSAGILSNVLKSRKKALFVFFGLTIIAVICYFSLQNHTAERMYWLCGFLGFSVGFSVLYITMSAEQFGTNLRATTAISIPNVVRGMLPLIILMFKGLRTWLDNFIVGAIITGIIIIGVAVLAGLYTQESYTKEMNFIEE